MWSPELSSPLIAIKLPPSKATVASTTGKLPYVGTLRIFFHILDVDVLVDINILFPWQISLTLGAHAQEGYCSCPVCVSVCLSVTTLAATSFVFTLKSRYVGVCYRLFLDFNSWIFEKTFHSNVMA